MHFLTFFSDLKLRYSQHQECLKGFETEFLLLFFQDVSWGDNEVFNPSPSLEYTKKDVIRAN